MGKRASQAPSVPPSADDVAAAWVDIGAVHEWAKNPRKNDGEPVDAVRASLIALGWGRPLIARKANGELVAGHTTRKAALTLKEAWESANAEQRSKWHPEAVQTAQTGLVPVRFVDLTERKAHQLALADNRLAEKSEWDVPILLDVMEELDFEEIEVAGWDKDELAELGADFLGGGDDGGKGGGGKGDLPGENGFKYSEKFAVIVTANDEGDQERIFNELSSSGYVCRVVCV